MTTTRADQETSKWRPQLARRSLELRGGDRLEFTRLGLGTAPLGNMHSVVAEDQALATVRRALQLGVEYFDSAPLYGSGISERRLGAALPKNTSALVSTKVGRLLEPRPAGEAHEGIYVQTPALKVRFDYSFDGVMRSFEASLRRLGRDSVDILFVHDVDAPTHGSRAAAEGRIDELMRQGGWRALSDLRAAGAVRAIGAGVNKCWPCERLLEIADPDLFLLAGRYTLLDQSAALRLLPACRAKGVGVVLGGPFNSGVLATGATSGAMYDYAPATEEILRRVRALETVCERHRVPLASAALQFPLGDPAIVCVLAGGRSAVEVTRNVGALEAPIPGELWDELKHEGLLDTHAPPPGSEPC